MSVSEQIGGKRSVLSACLRRASQSAIQATEWPASVALCSYEPLLVERLVMRVADAQTIGEE